jgi:DeoR family glycerol-3-phosphate regulon repressor
MMLAHHARMNTTLSIRKFTDEHSLANEVRQKIILSRVNLHGFQSVSDLSNHFSVSPQTIRRDVNALAMRGLCRRSHGGVWAITGENNIDYENRLTIKHDAKSKIAELVASKIHDGASLFLGIGTTMQICAAALSGKKGIRVMTNNLNAALELSKNLGTEVTIPGGRIRNKDFDLVSPEALDFFGRFAVDIGIFSVGGISDDGTLFDFHEEEVRMRNELIKNSTVKFLVFDHTKFGRGATVRSGHITDVDCIITDQLPPEVIVDTLNAAGVQLFIANSLSE